jgi:hypothetical protein
MNIVIDPVSEQLNQFFQAHGERLISAAAKDGFLKKPVLQDSQRPNLNDESLKVKENIKHLETLIRDICAKHPLWKLLFLFRKLPTIGYQYLQGAAENTESEESVIPVFQESIVFGTNAILKYSPNDHGLKGCNDRYSLEATAQEMEDVIRLMLFSIYHRTLMFRMNSISHLHVQRDRSYSDLLRIFNLRQEQPRLPDRIHSVEDALFYLSFIADFNGGEKQLVHKNHTGKECAVVVKNYIPYPVAQKEVLEAYADLDCPEFRALTGISFDHWWKIWVTLNRILKDNIIFLWSKEEAYSTYEDKMLAAAVRADDYTDTALGCGVISSITETCHSLAQIKYPEDAPSLNECNKFFEFLCCDQLPGDPRFVEQPFLFYKIGPDRVYWDYSRHSGMMRAVIRKLFSDPRKSAKRLITHFASKFEESIMHRLEKAVTGVMDIKLNVKIRDESSGRTVWEIDTGFVYRNILFLVEVKNWYKPEKYFLALDQALSNRAEGFEGVLHKQDDNLLKYRHQVFQKWSRPIAGAICVVCTEGVEFTASLDPEWWLQTEEIPRICLVNELINYLQSENIDNLQSHPRFVPADK